MMASGLAFMVPALLARASSTDEHRNSIGDNADSHLQERVLDQLLAELPALMAVNRLRTPKELTLRYGARDSTPDTNSTAGGWVLPSSKFHAVTDLSEYPNTPGSAIEGNCCVLS